MLCQYPIPFYTPHREQHQNHYSAVKGLYLYPHLWWLNHLPILFHLLMPFLTYCLTFLKVKLWELIKFSLNSIVKAIVFCPLDKQGIKSLVHIKSRSVCIFYGSTTCSAILQNLVRLSLQFREIGVLSFLGLLPWLTAQGFWRDLLPGEVFLSRRLLEIRSLSSFCAWVLTFLIRPLLKIS